MARAVARRRPRCQGGVGADAPVAVARALEERRRRAGRRALRLERPARAVGDEVDRRDASAVRAASLQSRRSALASGPVAATSGSASTAMRSLNGEAIRVAAEIGLDARGGDRVSAAQRAAPRRWRGRSRRCSALRVSRGARGRRRGWPRRRLRAASARPSAARPRAARNAARATSRMAVGVASRGDAGVEHGVVAGPLALEGRARADDPRQRMEPVDRAGGVADRGRGSESRRATCARSWSSTARRRVVVHARAGAGGRCAAERRRLVDFVGEQHVAETACHAGRPPSRGRSRRRAQRATARRRRAQKSGSDRSLRDGFGARRRPPRRYRSKAAGVRRARIARAARRASRQWRAAERRTPASGNDSAASCRGHEHRVTRSRGGASRDAATARARARATASLSEDERDLTPSPSSRASPTSRASRSISSSQSARSCRAAPPSPATGSRRRTC